MEEDKLSPPCGALSCRWRCGRGLARGLIVRVGRCQEVTGGRGQQMPEVCEDVATGRAQEARVSDFDEALGQDMLEEAVDACVGRERPVWPRLAPARFAAEGDVSVCELFHAVVGQGHAADGGGEGGEDRVAGANRCTLGDPCRLPDVGGGVIKPGGLGDLLLARAPEDLRQRAHRNTPILRAGCEPLRAVGRQCPSRDEGMAMRMGGPSAGPGVEDAHQAALAATVFGVQGESLQGRSSGRQAHGVPTLLVRTGSRPQGLRQGKGDEKRGHGQEPRPLRVEPPGGLVVLARGTMSILAGMIAGRKGLARCALGDMTAKRLGTAWCNLLHGSQVAWGQTVAAPGALRGAMESEEVGQLDHARPRETRRGCACVP
jgi:hypothetical protein